MVFLRSLLSKRCVGLGRKRSARQDTFQTLVGANVDKNESAIYVNGSTEELRLVTSFLKLEARKLKLAHYPDESFVVRDLVERLRDGDHRKL
jgi:hypothetical protein